MPNYDVVIAGAGLAGTAAALALSPHKRVLLADAGRIGAGATGVGAGIASPILARKGNPTYQAREALNALDALCTNIEWTVDVDRRRTALPLIRPAFDDAQVAYYRKAADQHPDLAQWIESADVTARFPMVRAPLGALQVARGQVINLADFARAIASAAANRGCEIREYCRIREWTEGGGKVIVRLACADSEIEIETDRLILALGSGYAAFPALAELNLHPIKGQTIRAKRPAALDRCPNITGPGYLAHDGPNIVLGSTFEHGLLDTEPTDGATTEILGLIKPIVPSVPDVAHYEARAGTRVTVPGTRLPMIGPITPSQRVWIFTGLGSKGLLMAPLLSARLASFLLDPGKIPERMLPHRPTRV